MLTMLVCLAGAGIGVRAKAEADSKAAMQVQAMFLNVGKADAALFTVAGKHYLVDTGTADAVDAILCALTYYGVTHLDGVLVTHMDKDHVGGLKKLLKSDLIVDQLYAPFFSTLALENHPVAKQAQKTGIPLTWLHAGDAVEIAADARWQVLGPMIRDSDNENNNSLVLRLITPQGDMLLAGDMEVPEEQTLLQAGVIQQAPVLKVGHHGEDDASSEAFIYTGKPQLAVISTNSDEEPDTPSPDVIARLWNIGAEVFVTQKASCCILVTLENGNAVGKLENYPLDAGAGTLAKAP